MNALGLFGAFGTLFAAGYGLLTLLVRRSVRLNLAEQIAFSWLFGTGAVSLLLWLFGFFAGGLLLQGLVSVVCISLGVIGWNLKTPSRLRTKPRWFEVVLVAVITIEIMIVFYLAFVHTLGWDGLLNWEIKARYAFANGGALPATYFSDSGRAFSHPEYPLAIPFTELWLYFWLGEPNQFLAKTIFPTFYVAGTFLVAAFSARLSGRTWLGLLMAAFLFFVPQITVEVGCASVGYADFPLSVFYLAAAGCLFCACEPGDDVFFRLYAACMALLPWIKRDGLILWTVAAACGVFVILRTRKSPLCFFAFLPGIIIIGAWRVYLNTTHALQAADFLPFNLETFRTHLNRVLPLLSALLAEFYSLPTWSLFWFIVAVAFLYAVPRMRDPGVIVVLVALIAPIVLYLSLYLFSSWPNYLEHVGLSISRLLMQVAPVGFLLVVLAISRRPKKRAHRVQVPNGVTCVIAGSERTAVVEIA
ncbi:MAG TPA: hypothetical protein VFJ55_04900 [Chthoniobacterales bacterium]|nr:hypothetical protein [Chthoniobacterales bacterium]